MTVLGSLIIQKRVRLFPCIYARLVNFVSHLGFSPSNTPHLTPALELDSAILEFSASLNENDLPTTICSDHDLHVIMSAFEKTVKGLNLWQYYVLDTVREKDSVKTAITSGKVEPWSGPNVRGKNVADLAEILRSEKIIDGLGKFASRYGVLVKGEVAAGFVQAAFTDLKEPEALADAWVKIVDVLNVPLYQEWEDDTKVAIGNVRNRVKYTRLDEHGPKMGKITKGCVYFSDY